MFYELANLSLDPFTMSKSLAALEHYTTGPASVGRLLGCWEMEHGDIVGRVLLLREFEDAAALTEERGRILTTANPFGVGEHARALEVTSHTRFPFLPPIEPGSYGAVYEIRTYHLAIGGLSPTIAGWQAAIPARTRLSPLTTAMYGLDGAPRMTHIWPYPDLNDRLAIRQRAAGLADWPPKEGPQYIVRANSAIGIPTAFSPLT